jgi:hypothetical protein
MPRRRLPRPMLHEMLDRMWRAIRGPGRPPRVTDDGDDGLAGAPVPRRPKPVTSSGGAARALPIDEPAGSSNAEPIAAPH